VGRVGNGAGPWGDNGLALTSQVVVIANESHQVQIWPLQSAVAVAVSPLSVPAPTTLTVSPNPFNPRTRLGFTLAAAGRADLAVYDLAGRLVRRLERADLPAGPQVRTWEGDDDAGRSLPSGTYVARLVTAAGVETRKVVLVR
jgi:hypothetical protein